MQTNIIQPAKGLLATCIIISLLTTMSFAQATNEPLKVLFHRVSDSSSGDREMNISLYHLFNKMENGEEKDLGYCDFVRVYRGRKWEDLEAKLMPGKYRIAVAGSLAWPYFADQAFEVIKGAQEPIQVEVKHQKKALAQGNLVLVSENNGRPFAGVFLNVADKKQEIMVKMPSGNTSYFTTLDRLPSDTNGLIKFVFWDDAKEVAFTTADFRLATKEHPQTCTFKRDDYIKGAVWKVHELPVMARLKVLVRTPDIGDVPLDEQVLLRYITDTNRVQGTMPYWGIMVYDAFSDVPTVNETPRFVSAKAPTWGQFNPQSKEFEFRHIDGNHAYTIGRHVQLFGAWLEIVEGGMRTVNIQGPETDIGTVVVANELFGEKRKAYVNGSVVEENGLPLLGAKITISGSVGRTNLVSNEAGKYKCVTQKGQNTLSISKNGYISLATNIFLSLTNTITTVLKKQTELSVTVLENKNPISRQGQITVFNSTRKTSDMFRDVVGGASKIEISETGTWLIVVGVWNHDVSDRPQSLVDYTFWTREINPEMGRENHIDVDIDTEPRKLDVKVDVTEIRDDQGKNMEIILRGLWHKSSFIAGASILNAEKKGMIPVPVVGAYLPELLILGNKKDTEDHYENAMAFFCEKISINENTRELILKVNGKTKHKFEPWL